MAVRVVYLGRLAELAGAPDADLVGPLDWDALTSSQSAKLAEELASDRVRVAVNGKLMADKTALAAHDGDEVALLPPVSGG